MKLNLGCGLKKKQGYVNCDINKNVNPDKIIDLNKFPYNFDEETADEIFSDNVVEHLWVELPDFVSEMRRILKKDGVLEIVTPNCFFWKNRLSFLIGNFRSKNGWHINHSFLLKPSVMRQYLELNGFDVNFIRPPGVWGRFAWLSENLFLQEIHFRARKRN